MTGELAGLEVISTRAERRMLRIADHLGSLSDAKGGFTEGDIILLEQVYEAFAEALISWNLEDWRTGAPVPPTLAGMLEQDAAFMLDVISAWLLTAPTEPDAEEIEAIEAALTVVPLTGDTEDQEGETPGDGDPA